jgi:hypothetical protein
MCIYGGSSEAVGGGGGDNRLLHCMFSIALGEWSHFTIPYL